MNRITYINNGLVISKKKGILIGIATNLKNVEIMILGVTETVANAELITGITTESGESIIV